MAVRTELSAGTRLASYTVESVLGRGAMSVVYAATDSRLDRRVALKVLAPPSGDDERFRERFLSESRLAASIDHPHVIPIYEAGEADGLLFIAMRLVDGTDLRGLLARRRTLDPARALAIIGQTASALDAAHARGLLHRDVKPENILLASEEGGADHVYLSDFGLAMTAAAAVTVLDGGSFHGTPEYAAPEQIEGSPEGRSDVYSLACVLFECLTGEPPFGRGRLLSTLFAHLHDEPPLLSERRPELPAAADDVFAEALAKEPAERPESCGDFAVRAGIAFGLGESRRRRLVPVLAVAFAAIALALGVGSWLVFRGDAPTAAAERGPRIETFAGTGESGFAGDGGPAGEALLRTPSSVAVDDAGRVYVGDPDAGAVRRIDPDGTIETVTPTAWAGGYVEVAEVAVGPDGDLYILQHANPALVRIDSRGIPTMVVGTGELGFVSDHGLRTHSRDLCGDARSPAFDPAGTIYVACPLAHRILRVESDGTYTTVAGSARAGYAGDGGPATEAMLNSPSAIAFDRAGNLYIADSHNHRVRKVDGAGRITTIAGTGEGGLSGDGWRATSVPVWSPIDVEVDSAGNIFVLEGAVPRLRRIDENGIMTTVAGTGSPGYSGDGGRATDARLHQATDFSIGLEGEIYIADVGNHRVRVVTEAAAPRR